MLLPHLSDDDLFAMEHILKDRSKEPIKTYVRSLFDRDVDRTSDLLSAARPFDAKAKEAFGDLASLIVKSIPMTLAIDLMGSSLKEKRISSSPISDFIAIDSLKIIANMYGTIDEVRQLYNDVVNNSKSPFIEALAIRLIAETWQDETTRKLINEKAVQDGHPSPRGAALNVLAKSWPDKTTRELITERSIQDKNIYIRRAAIKLLAEKWPDKATRELLVECVLQDENEIPREAAIEQLAAIWPDKSTRKLLIELADQDDHEKPRKAALKALAEKWPDEAAST